MERLSLKPTVAMSLHGYGRTLLYPYSCKAFGVKLDQTVKQRFDQSIKDILQGISAKYLTGQAWNVPDLYTVNGDIVDYLYSVFSIPSFNVEVRMVHSCHLVTSGLSTVGSEGLLACLQAI